MTTSKIILIKITYSGTNCELVNSIVFRVINSIIIIINVVTVIISALVLSSILTEKLVCRFGDMVALQKNNTLNDKLEYVAFTLIFILFGLAVVAASLDLLVLRFVTMNTEDERRDEAEALQVKKKKPIIKNNIIPCSYNSCTNASSPPRER